MGFLSGFSKVGFVENYSLNFMVSNIFLQFFVSLGSLTLITPIGVEIGAHTWAKPAFLHTVYAPFYGAPSVYALVS